MRTLTGSHALRSFLKTPRIAAMVLISSSLPRVSVDFVSNVGRRLVSSSRISNERPIRPPVESQPSRAAWARPISIMFALTKLPHHRENGYMGSRSSSRGRPLSRARFKISVIRARLPDDYHCATGFLARLQRPSYTLFHRPASMRASRDTKGGDSTELQALAPKSKDGCPRSRASNGTGRPISRREPGRRDSLRWAQWDAMACQTSAEDETSPRVPNSRPACLDGQDVLKPALILRRDRPAVSIQQTEGLETSFTTRVHSSPPEARRCVRT